ncbi:MAG: hypothetical protein R3305_07910, partial [Gammaproteobacteria bacterium]|nr:hypothetical protein [Gammaproteobacteria bacterium]
MTRYSALAFSAIAANALAQPATDADDTIQVVGQTPLGAGVDIDRIAANVQQASSSALREQRALDLADFMKRSLGSVHV